MPGPVAALHVNQMIYPYHSLQKPWPNEAALAMDGRLCQVGHGCWEALLPSPAVQNHAAFEALATISDGLACLWFGGSLEG